MQTKEGKPRFSQLVTYPCSVGGIDSIYCHLSDNRKISEYIAMLPSGGSSVPEMNSFVGVRVGIGREFGSTRISMYL